MSTHLGITSTRRTAVLSVVVASTCAVTLSGVVAANSAAAAPRAHTRALNIMLTNDDGVTSQGLIAVRDALCKAGQRVTVVGPGAQQSGSGARISTTGSLKAKRSTFRCGKRTSSTWAVEGSPADTVLFATSVVFKNKLPDLVVSGSNRGNNMSTIVASSGTVGAALTASSLGIPAIAVSSDVAPATVANSEAVTNAGYAATGKYIAKLVSRLQSVSGQTAPLLPSHSYLNVNYPLPITKKGAFAPSKVKRTIVTRLAQQNGPIFSYQPTGGGNYKATVNPCLVSPSTAGCVNQPGTDFAAIASDHVSLTYLTIQASATAPNKLYKAFTGLPG